MAADESSHIIGWNVKNGWYPRGRPAWSPVCLSRNRSCSYGALGPGGFHCHSCDKNNTDSFIDFLAGLRARFGRVLLFVDNAGYHKSARLRRRLAEWDGDTPADRAGIRIQGENKWKTIIQNAAKSALPARPGKSRLP